MEIKTKFDFGQRVQAIANGRRDVATKCPVCDGTGVIDVPNFGKTECPKCYGEKFLHKYVDEGWYVPNWEGSNFVVQRIGMEMYSKKNKRFAHERSWIYCMAGSSGTMYNEEDCFTSIEEAQAECDRRNSETKK